MSQEKVSNIKLVAALTVICIILAASLVGVIAIYLRPQNNPNEQASDTTLSSL